ncbi:ATP-binding protein [Geoalkalibacter halelectricus]|nr:ATP-binding protein [Geoalkalibacter halelectricus]MDO3380471.1 ATP-binding protein [Geoalkalibacter halelectricus]
MSASAALTSQLKTLKLGRMLDTLDVRLLQARQDQLGYLEFLQLLLQDEIERRKTQSLRLRLQRQFRGAQDPGGVRLRRLSHPQSRRHPRSGHRAVHRAARACSALRTRRHRQDPPRPGPGAPRLPIGALGLVSQGGQTLRTLQSSRADNSWDAELRRLLAPDLLIIDDFGLKPMTMTQAEDFYEIVAERHLRGSIIVTSNRPPADWLSLFPDPVMANSALDRLAHNAHHFVMKGESYRKKMRPNSPAPATNQTEHTEGQTAQ